MPKTAIDFEALLDYAQTADIANDPLVVDLCAAIVALQERLDDAQIWADANREFFQRPMHWELTRILQDADTILDAVSDPQRRNGE